MDAGPVLAWLRAAGMLQAKAVAAIKQLRNVGPVTDGVKAEIQRSGSLDQAIRSEIVDSLKRCAMDPAYNGTVLRYWHDPSPTRRAAIVAQVMEWVTIVDKRELAEARLSVLFEEHVHDVLGKRGDEHLRQHRETRAAADEHAQATQEQVARLAAQLESLRREVLSGQLQPKTSVDRIEVTPALQLTPQEALDEEWKRVLREAEPNVLAWITDVLNEHGRSGLHEPSLEPPNDVPTAQAWSTLGSLLILRSRWQAARRALLRAADLEVDENELGSILHRASTCSSLQGDREGVHELELRLQTDAPDSDAARLDRIVRLRAGEAYEQALALQPAGRRERSRVAALLTDIALGRNEFDLAEAHRNDALEADPYGIHVRDLRAKIDYRQLVHDRIQSVVDPQRARQIADAFAELQAEAQQRDLISEALYMTWRAEALFAGDLDQEAKALLNSGRLVELIARHPGAAMVAARVAIQHGEVELALKSLPEEVQDFDGGVTRASILLEAADPEVHAEAMRTLEAILDGDDDDLKPDAAAALLIHAGSSWHERASEVMQATSPMAWGMMRSHHLLEMGDFTGAEATLLPLLPDPDAQRLLAMIAGRQGDHSTALTRAEQLAKSQPYPHNRLRAARIAYFAGQHERSNAQLELLLAEANVPASIRARAAETLSDQLHDMGDLAGYRRATSLWLELAPDSSNAAWSNVYANLLDGNEHGANQIIGDHELEPANASQARIYITARDGEMPTADLVREAAEISERLGFVEEIERFIVSRGLTANDQEAHDIAVEAGKRFPERFDGVSVLQEIDVDFTTHDGIEAFFAQVAAPVDRVQAHVNVQREIWAGTQFMAVLADMVNRDIGEIWDRAGGWPLRYDDAELVRLDRDAASAALGTGAIVEPSAIAMLGRLDVATVDRLLSLLGAARVTRETLLTFQDARQRMNAVNAPVGEGGFDHETGKPFAIQFTDEQVEERRTHSARRAEIAESLDQIGVDRTKLETNEDELLENGGRTPALSGCVSSLLVAKQLKLPLYADDRFVRLQARIEGVVCFGTVDLIEIACERGILDEVVAANTTLILAERGMGLGNQILDAAEADANNVLNHEAILRLAERREANEFAADSDSDAQG